MRSARLALVTAGTALALAACGGESGESGSTEAAVETAAPSETDAPDPTDAPAETEAPAATDAPDPAAAPADTEAPPATEAPVEAVVAPAALQFTAPLVGGGELDAATLADKPTVFWFWAPT